MQHDGSPTSRHPSVLPWPFSTLQLTYTEYVWRWFHWEPNTCMSKNPALFCFFKIKTSQKRHRKINCNLKEDNLVRVKLQLFNKHLTHPLSSGHGTNDSTGDSVFGHRKSEGGPVTHQLVGVLLNDHSHGHRARTTRNAIVPGAQNHLQGQGKQTKKFKCWLLKKKPLLLVETHLYNTQNRNKGQEKFDKRRRVAGTERGKRDTHKMKSKMTSFFLPVFLSIPSSPQTNFRHLK